MKFIIWLLVLLLPGTPAFAAIVVDQTSAQDDVSNVGTSTRNLSFTVTPAAGSFVAVCFAGSDYTATGTDFITSFTDNQGNGTYTLIKQAPQASHWMMAALAYKENVASSGTFTVTATFTNSTSLYYVWRLISFTGISSSAAIDKQNSGGGSVAETGLAISTAATTVADELVIACGGAEASDTTLNFAQSEAGYTNYILQNDATNVNGARGIIKWWRLRACKPRPGRLTRQTLRQASLPRSHKRRRREPRIKWGSWG